MRGMQVKQHGPPNRLRELRRAADLKLYDLSAQLRVDTSTISRWEKGSGPIPDPAKLALAEIFGVSVAHLMGWEQHEAA